MKKIEELIQILPENFPDAAEEIKKHIIPLLAECDKGVIDHYAQLIKKRTKAASKKAVTTLIIETIWKLNFAMGGCANELADPDPEIVKAALYVARDPQLFRKKIDLVNELGVAGERRNVALNLVTIDSRLMPLKNGKPENLGLKNVGHQGSGKSNQVNKSLKLYPKTAFHIISNVSAKGLLLEKDQFKYKAVVFNEAKAFESSGKKDTDPAHIIRELLSEGYHKYQRQIKTPMGWETEYITLEGPIALLTTTIRGKLEQQLDDRILKVQTDTSSQQTIKVIHRLAADAAGTGTHIDDAVLNTWRYYHDSLESMQVVVPFAAELLDNLPEHAPVAARRAFTRVISVIKTFTILYQSQRETDEHGRLVAEYADYAMAYQLIEPCFAESVKPETEITENRVELIKAEKKMTAKALAEASGVSSPTISEWIKSAIGKGLITWCNEHGEEFDDINALNKARHCGIGYLRIVTGKSLPTPYELTGDPRWDKGGDLYALYDLHLDAEGPVKDDFSAIYGGLRFINNERQEDDEAAEEQELLYDIPDKAMMH